MAAFRIHQDLEKENNVKAVLASKSSNGAVVGKDKVLQQRSNFGVIKENHNILQPKILNVLKPQEAKQGINSENDIIPDLGKFHVYEDTKRGLQTKDTAHMDRSQTSANLSDGAIRDPLKEMKRDDFLETPMSVAEMLSPMSVDKSAIIEEQIEKPLPRTDRDRFFEVTEYQDDILTYMKDAEQRLRAKPNYMRKQPDINYSMRTILVDWLVEVCEEYRLQGETLCLAVSYIDRFLSYMSVVRAKLQLVGTAAMFIAAKYEEIYPPDVAEFVYITDDTYSKSQVLRMEQLILKVLSFDLSAPSSLSFISLYKVMTDMPDKIKNLAQYFCELSLLEADPFLQCLPSKISAAAVALANHTMGLPMWTSKFQQKIGYGLEELKEIVLELNKLHKTAATMQQQALRDKYKGSKYMQVSQIEACDIDETVFTLPLVDDLNDPTPVDDSTNCEDSENNENVRQMISSLLHAAV